MRVLLCTPPMTQLNTPYPATAYLCGFLRLHAERLGLEVAQADPALELFLALASRPGLTALCERLTVGKRKRDDDASVAHFLAERERYLATVEPTIRFLQGKDPSLALRIASRDYLPEGPRFAAIDPALAAEPDGDPLAWAFGELGVIDRAKYLASLYVDDLADVLRAPRSQLRAVALRRAARGQRADLRSPGRGAGGAADPDRRHVGDDHPRADREPPPGPARPDRAVPRQPVRRAAHGPDRARGGARLSDRARRRLRQHRAARPARAAAVRPGRLRHLDDGEAPLLALLEHLRDPARPLHRTFVRVDGAVELRTADGVHDVPLRDAGTPTYAGLPLDRYLSLVEMLNPMHRLWSDGRWNKLTVAHGCYWKKCSFCDVTLDYIGRYDPVGADLLVDRIEAIVAETGQTGFHLVDEAAPPAG
jgi:hypothetical protein